MSSNVDQNLRPDYDPEIQAIVDYVLDYRIDSEEAWDTARNCLIDTLGCGLLALRFPECSKHLGPLVEGTQVPHGARVPGTPHRLDPAIVFVSSASLPVGVMMSFHCIHASGHGTSAMNRKCPSCEKASRSFQIMPAQPL